MEPVRKIIDYSRRYPAIGAIFGTIVIAGSLIACEGTRPIASAAFAENKNDDDHHDNDHDNDHGNDHPTAPSCEQGNCKTVEAHCNFPGGDCGGGTTCIP